jgi:hypothetical protein
MTEIEGVEDVQETPLGSISGFRELDPTDDGDDEFVIEGSPEAAEVVTPQPAEAGQSAEDIKAQLEALKAQMAQAQGVQGLQSPNSPRKPRNSVNSASSGCTSRTRSRLPRK